jgi:hypothetical protein
MFAKEVPMATTKQQSERATGVENVAYDLMTVLTNKLQGIAAIEQYKQDARSDQEVFDCFERIEQREREDVDQLRGLVASRLGR